MKYEDILKSHLKYGSTKEDIVKRNEYENILESVVIAPWWDHNIFENSNVKIDKVNDKIYNIYGENLEFSFIELKLVGSPVMLDQVLSLGTTKCKNILFIGSVGALDENINLGDIVIPEYSICGEGASRYLNDNLKDEFGKKEYPSKEFTERLLNIVNKQNNIKYHYVPNYTVDTIFTEYIHIDKIIGMGAKTIEMETSALFKASKLLNMNVTALFLVSDNTIINKLYEEAEKGNISIDNFIDMFEDDETVNYLSGIMSSDFEITDVDKCIEDVIVSYRKEFLINRRKEILNKLTEAQKQNLAENEVASLEEELNSIIIKLAKMK